MTEEELQKRIEALEADLDKANEDKKTALGEKFKLAKELKDAQDAAEEAVENAKVETGSELDKANRRIAKLEKDLDAANERADTSSKSLRDYKTENALAAAITDANVDSQHIKILTKALRADVEFDDDGEPSIDGKSIADFTKAYFAKDGLSYVRAPDNNGGGATGSDNSKPMTWTKLPETGDEWKAFNSLDTAERNALCDRFGAPQLKV